MSKIGDIPRVRLANQFGNSGLIDRFKFFFWKKWLGWVCDSVAVVSVGSTNTTVTHVSFSHNFMISEMNLFQVKRLNTSYTSNKEK